MGKYDPAIAVAVGWDGPHAFYAACQRSQTGLYLCWGRQRFGPSTESRLLYVGISDGSRGVGGRIKDHQGKPFCHPGNDWWIGEIMAPSGYARQHLEAAEWMLIHFEGPEYNDKKTVNPPRFRCYLVNQWYKPTSERWERTTGAAWALSDVLAWSPDSGTAQYAERLRPFEP